MTDKPIIERDKPTTILNFLLISWFLDNTVYIENTVIEAMYNIVNTG